MRIIGLIFTLLLICSACQTKPSTDYDFENLVDKISYSVGYGPYGMPALASIEVYNLNKNDVITGFVDRINGKRQLSEEEADAYYSHIYSREVIKRYTEKVVEHAKKTRPTHRAGAELGKLFTEVDTEWKKNRVNWKLGQLKYKHTKNDLTKKTINLVELDLNNIKSCLGYAVGLDIVRSTELDDIVKVLRLNKDFVITGFIDRMMDTPQIDLDEQSFYAQLGHDLLDDDIRDIEKLEMERRVERRLKNKRTSTDEPIKSFEELQEYRKRVNAWAEKNKKK